jgi:hypothetical protein
MIPWLEFTVGLLIWISVLWDGFATIILPRTVAPMRRVSGPTLQSHLAHPVLAFYRAHHWGRSWLVSLTTVLDSCALLIAGSDGPLAEQARLTYRIGLHLLRDLSDALSITVDPQCPIRLTQADLPVLRAAMETARLTFILEQRASDQLLRLVRRYDVYPFGLSSKLVIPLPSLIPSIEGRPEADDSERR